MLHGLMWDCRDTDPGYKALFIHLLMFVLLPGVGCVIQEFQGSWLSVSWKPVSVSHFVGVPVFCCSCQSELRTNANALPVHAALIHFFLDDCRVRLQTLWKFADCPTSIWYAIWRVLQTVSSWHLLNRSFFVNSPAFSLVDCSVLLKSHL